MLDPTCPSPRICTSICLALTRNLSMKIVPSPKADNASDPARSYADASSSSLRTTRIPRPPPPIAALSMTGSPYFFTKAKASATSRIASEPGTIGMPASVAMSTTSASAEIYRVQGLPSARADVLSPIRSMESGVGPTHLIPAASTLRANTAFSDRKP